MYYRNNNHLKKAFTLMVAFIIILTYTSFTSALESHTLVPPADFQAIDTPDDNGKSITLRWPSSPSELPEVEYIIYASVSENGPFDTEVLRISSISMYEEGSGFHSVKIMPHKFFNDQSVDKDVRKSYFFKLVMASNPESVEAGKIVSATPVSNWFNRSKLNNFIIMIIFSALVLLFIEFAKKNPNLYLRKISGLDAIDEALGRATEMGKPVMFVHGLNGMGSISTIAAVNILGRIAIRVAEYDTTLKVSNIDPIVLSVSQEVVKESYLEAGRPDAYIEDNVFMAASEQFPYVAAVSGIMIRERSAANFFMGYFYAESLILAETGASTGAIQIAATDSYTQLPFFITTCDYTLIGEELYAASAYLSREPLLLGSLRAQDIAKGIIIAVLVAGAILATFGIDFLTNIFKAN